MQWLPFSKNLEGKLSGLECSDWLIGEDDSDGLSQALKLFSHPDVAMPLSEVRVAPAHRAAALILLYPKAEGIHLLLLRRGEWMDLCPGMIEFPGGTVDSGEAPLKTALREAFEEANIEPHAVKVLGELVPVINCKSNFLVHFFLGISQIAPDLKIQDCEISSLHEVSLSSLSLLPSTTSQATSLNGDRILGFKVNGEIVTGTAALALAQLKFLLG